MDSCTANTRSTSSNLTVEQTVSNLENMLREARASEDRTDASSYMTEARTVTGNVTTYLDDGEPHSFIMQTIT